MRLDKRAQISAGVIIAIILVAVLHLLVFSEQRSALERASSQYQQTINEYQGLAKSPGEEMLDAYTSKTTTFLASLQQGMDQLGLERPEMFNDPDVAPEDPEFFPMLMRKIQEQRQTIAQAVEELAQYRTSNQSRMTFLNQDNWALPLQLPTQLSNNPPQLWDLLERIRDNREKLELLSEDSASRSDTEAMLDQLMRYLGWNPDKVDRLDEYGEYVPLFYKLQFANLILDLKGEDEIILVRQEELNRENLHKWLGIQVPTEQIQGINEYKSYFIYEYLDYLNELLAMAEEHGLYEVNSVELWGWGFLRSRPDAPVKPHMTVKDPEEADYPDDTTLAYDYFDAPEAEGTGGAGGMGFPYGDMGAEGMDMNALYEMYYGGGAMGAGGPGGAMQQEEEEEDAPEEAVEKEEEDIGYALPIEMTFIATNDVGWSYIYDVLRRYPMAELYRLELQSLGQQNPNNLYIEFKPTFLMVPELFDTLTNVRQVLQELEGAGGSTPTQTQSSVLPTAP